MFRKEILKIAVLGAFGYEDQQYKGGIKNTHWSSIKEPKIACLLNGKKKKLFQVCSTGNQRGSNNT
jgi:hypothetical protein